jgi:cysteine-rich repeat protein
MRTTHAIVPVLLAALAGGAVLVPEAHALTACTAAQVSSQDPGCPSGTGPCTITKDFDVGDGCTLDFGMRAVTVASSGKIGIATGAVTILAGSLTIAPAGTLIGRGGQTPPARGGFFTIRTTGAIDVQNTAAGEGSITVNGYGGGGTILLDALGSITVAGRLRASSLTSGADGGTLDLRAGGDFVSGAGSIIEAAGGSAGGLIDITALGRVDLGASVDARGGSGGLVEIQAEGEAVVRGVTAQATGDAGTGGCVGIVAATTMQPLGNTINISGSGSLIGSGGGDGGFACVESKFGDLTISGRIHSIGADPDGSGGAIALISRGSISVAAGAEVSAGAQGSSSFGGELALDAFLDLTNAGLLDIAGGSGAFCLDLHAGRDITLGGSVDARARADGGTGGAGLIEAGASGKGTLTISGTVNAGGGPTLLTPCDGQGGSLDFEACNLTVTATGSVLNRGAFGGDITFIARELLTIQGSVDATRLEGACPEGTNTLTHKSGVPPVISGVVTPAPVLDPRPPCTPSGPPGCLLPCPACGNGVIEFPETCDTVGTPQSCDGCSLFCQLENCDDANACTTDSCSPALGCRSLFLPDGTSCTDGDICNGVEECRGGSCQAEGPLNCDDGDPCTNDPCDAVTGCAAHTPAPPGAPCTDNNACTEPDTCDEAGTCQPGGTRTCVDGLECTTDGCSPATGCTFTNRTGPCTPDTNVCTSDVCSGGLCTHPAVTNGTPCTSDSNPCTSDICTAGACTHPAVTNGTPCTSDGNECTSDVCTAGACTHPAVTNGTPCTSDGNVCTSDVCTAGACTHPPAPNGTACTSDSDPCTSDVCTAGVCTHPPGPNGTACNDGAFCTVNDTCQGGMCTGAQRSCADTNACTADSCNEAGDVCVNTPITPCCGNGVPEAGEQCDDGNASNTDACLNTCVAATCGDGFVRTGVEQCDLGAGNSNAPNATCRTDCRPARCGDGVTDDLRGEQCDDGNGAAGDGCSPSCFAEPPSTADRIPGKGGSTTDCVLEWAMDRPALNSKGIPAVKQTCVDGDPSCDFGATPDECTFRVWSCSNNNEPLVPFCQPGAAGAGTPVSVEAIRPNAKEAAARPVDAANRQELLRATGAALVTTLDTCGPRMDIRVPLKDPAKAGKRVLKVRANTSRGLRDSDVLKLVCLP